MWVLIIIVVFGSNGGTISNVEFKTKDRCLKAADFIGNNKSNMFYVIPTCVQK